MAQHRQGNLHAEHAVNLPRVAQWDGVGNGFIAADRVALQIERLRPVAQHFRLRVRVLPCRPPRSIIEGIRVPVSLTAHGKVCRPVAAKSNAHLPGQPGAAPGQLQIGIIHRLGVGIRVPDIKARNRPGFLRVSKGSQEEEAAGIAAAGLPQTDREHRQQKFLLPLLRRRQLPQGQPVVGQVAFQRGGDLRLALSNPGPTLEHLALQLGASVLRVFFQRLHRGLLNGANDAPEHDDPQNDGALHQHQDNQRHQKQLKY